MRAPRTKPPLGPVLAAAGLILVIVATVLIYRTWTPALAGGPTASPTAPTATAIASGPTPYVSPLEVQARTSVPGTLVYVRDDGLWVQSGTVARRITASQDGSSVSGPTWSPDGVWIYYIETRIGTGRWYNPNNGNEIVEYKLTYPVLCRIHPDGTGREEILSGLIRSGSLRTFYWIRQPSVSPDGLTLVVISDGPTWPGGSDNVLHLVTPSTHKLGSALMVPEKWPFGLSEPAYSPDGGLIAYVMENRSGKYGAPSIWVYDLKAKAARRVAAGYRDPAWSPDGKYLAAARVDHDDLDVVVLDASSGEEISRVTMDGVSWGPVWSPAGDALIYMRLRGSDVDLRMVQVEGSGESMAFRLEADLTDYSGLDGGSRAAWYIPGAGPSEPSPQPSATE